MRNRCTRASPGARSPFLLLAGLVLAVGLGACASSGGGDDDLARGSSDHIPREELADRLGPSVSLYQAVQRLRPAWLRPSRGVSGSGQRFEPLVYLDDRRFGPIGSLRQLRVSDAEELRYISASDATTRYGTGVPAGVIAVYTRSN